jgi:hypothetical protein
MEDICIDTLGLIIGQLAGTKAPYKALLALYSTSWALYRAIRALMATGWAQVLFDQLMVDDVMDNTYLAAIIYKWNGQLRAKEAHLYDFRPLLADDWAWLWPCFDVSSPDEIVEIMLKVKRPIPPYVKPLPPTGLSRTGRSYQYNTEIYINSEEAIPFYLEKSINYLAFGGHLASAIKLMNAYGNKEYMTTWLIACILLHERIDIFMAMGGRYANKGFMSFLLRASISGHGDYIANLMAYVGPKMAKEVYGHGAFGSMNTLGGFTSSFVDEHIECDGISWQLIRDYFEYRQSASKSAQFVAALTDLAKCATIAATGGPKDGLVAAIRAIDYYKVPSDFYHMITKDIDSIDLLELAIYATQLAKLTQKNIPCGLFMHPFIE